MTELLDLVLAFVANHWPRLTIAGVALPAIATAVRAFVRHPKSSPATAGEFLSAHRLLLPPLTRPAYSDRMAYVLAELADLAYYRFEDAAFFAAAVKEIEAKKTTGEVSAFLSQYTIDLLGSRRALGQEWLGGLLQDRDFSLIDVIDIGTTQGFICKRDVTNEPSYVVLSFRGTEKDVADWLTDASCVPVLDGETKVHEGFRDAFTVTVDEEGHTVESKVRDVLSRAGG